jgi:hypothetical protein
MSRRSEVNRSFFLCLAACHMRHSANDTLSRFCARHVVWWSTFLLALVPFAPSIPQPIARLANPAKIFKSARRDALTHSC